MTPIESELLAMMCEVTSYLLRNQFIAYLNDTVREIGIFNIQKWSLYTIEIITAFQIFQIIFFKLRIKTPIYTFCFAYGSVTKCMYGARMVFLDLMTSVFALTTSVLKDYINIPEVMLFDEIELCAFRFGFMMLTRNHLNYWYLALHSNSVNKKSSFVKKNRINKNNEAVVVQNMFCRINRIHLQVFLLLLFREFLTHTKEGKKA